MECTVGGGSDGLENIPKTFFFQNKIFRKKFILKWISIENLITNFFVFLKIHHVICQWIPSLC